jgi:Cd2+/Zn2+-exporting ATPase
MSHQPLPVIPLHPVANAPNLLHLDVTGMDCGDCAKTIQSSLASMPGVRHATVAFATGTAQVGYDQQHIAPADITGRIKSLGYGVRDTPAADSMNWVFDVSGMDCGDCAKTVESTVRHLPNIATATVNFGSATLTVTPTNGETDQAGVVNAVAQAGYRATLRSPAPAVAGQQLRPGAAPWWRSRRILEIGIAGLSWIGGFAIEHAGGPSLLVAILYIGAMILAGYPVARAAWYALKVRRADMNVLMAIAAIGGAAIGRWDEGSSVLILFAIGLTLQSLTLDRTRQAIQALMKLSPTEATVRRDGVETRIAVGEVHVGELVYVRPGDRIPVDGQVVDGASSVNQASITGESLPVDVEAEDHVFAGSINGDGVLEIRSTRPATDTAIARIIHMVEEAQASKAPAQAFVDRFAAIYTPIVIGTALVLVTIVPLFVGDFRDWLFKALILLVVACPCALVISTPVALVAAIGSGSRHGILFKGGAAIEALSTVRTVAFDKTGTLTAGRPVVTDVVPFREMTARHLLARAAAVEQHASHPIATAVVEAWQRHGYPLPVTRSASTRAGRGAQAIVDGETLVVGSRRMFGELPTVVEQQLATLEQQGKTTVLVGTPDRVDGVIALADAIRSQSVDAVSSLASHQIKTVMLTGDNAFTAERIARQAGVSDVRANLLPEDKVSAIRDLEREHPVAMVGDGVNDAPALAVATVGVAMGGAGTDVAVEAADVVLMSDDLARLPGSVILARRTMAIIRQNIVLAIAVKVLFLVLTFAGWSNLWLAVLADSGMALVVTFNSLRLLGVLKTPSNDPGSPLDRYAQPAHDPVAVATGAD